MLCIFKPTMLQSLNRLATSQHHSQTHWQAMAEHDLGKGKQQVVFMMMLERESYSSFHFHLPKQDIWTVASSLHGGIVKQQELQFPP